jgi:hypothetical protein
MSAVDQFEDDLLDLIFTNVDAPNIGDAAGLQNSATEGSLHVSLITDGTAVGETDTSQLTGEAAYGSYARQPVGRNIASWTVASGTVDNDSPITYPQATSGTETEDQFGIGFALAGAGYLQIYGSLTGTLAVSTGITPEFAAGDLDISIN